MTELERRISGLIEMLQGHTDGPTVEDVTRAAIALVVEEAVKAIDLQAEPILEALQRAKDAGDRELGRIYSDAAAVLLRARRAVRALAPAETREG